MNRRLLPVLLFVAVPAVLGVGSEWSRSAPGLATSSAFSQLGQPVMPFVPKAGFINSTWFCPGVPVGGDGLGGSVTIANPADAPLSGRITVYSDDADALPAEQGFVAPARSATTIDLPGLQPKGTFVSAMVEIVGGGGFVEQRADHPDGSAVSPCANSPASTWYFADGYTLSGSTENLVVTNPFPDPAILDFKFATNQGTREPRNLQGVAVSPRSMLVVSQASLPKDEVVLSVTIAADRGRVVAGRSQVYRGERQGFTMNLGAPSLSDEYWFADGEQTTGVFERYSIYNPTDREVTVRPVFLGVTSETFTNDLELTVPAGEVVSLSVADVPDLPAGPHGAFFGADAPSIVVERAITRPATDGSVATTVVMGAPAVFSGYSRWSMAIGTTLAVDGVLAVLNLDGLEATVTVKAVGAGGEVPIAGLVDVVVPAGGVVRLAIPDDPVALGVPLIVESSQRIVVERLLPRGDGLRGRSGSLAMPG